ncbi:MAG: hypothetical protein OXB88_06575 [Bacteriovoracales bacterium]|nr:hypothetical protein [Bacteriovoracales bacterium]
MKTEKMNNVPWRNSKGHPLSLEKIKLACKSWNEETYDAYLRDMIEVKQQELPLGNPKTAENYSAEKHRDFYKAPQRNGARNLELKKAIRCFVATLPETERAIVKMMYWDGLKRNQVARSIGRSYRFVKERHDKAIKILMGEIIRAVKWNGF